MLTIPLQPVPNQILTIPLNNQNTQINCYQKSTGLFVDILLNDEIIQSGIIARNQCLMLMNLYLGFSGDFMFIDNEGSCNPWYSGLGGRFTLIYLAPSDFPANSLYL